MASLSVRGVFLAAWLHLLQLQLQLRLVLSDLLTRGLGLRWRGRMVGFNQQLVDQRSQQRPHTGSH